MLFVQVFVLYLVIVVFGFVQPLP